MYSDVKSHYPTNLYFSIVHITFPFNTLTFTSAVCLSVSDYKDSLLRQCCLDGMAETPLSYSCERRMEYISDGKACADAFLKCCQELTKLRTESRTEALYAARSKYWG